VSDAASPLGVATVIYIARRRTQGGDPCGETDMSQVSQPQKKDKIMGDRSPKSNQKKTSQKQAKASSADQKKKQAVAAKSAAGKKR
jgi:hypothetical protein